MLQDHELISLFCQVDDFINDWQEKEKQNLLPSQTQTCASGEHV